MSDYKPVTATVAEPCDYTIPHAEHTTDFGAITFNCPGVPGAWRPDREQDTVIPESDRGLYIRLTDIGARTEDCPHGVNWRSVCNSGCDDKDDEPPDALTDTQTDAALDGMTRQEMRSTLKWLAGARPREFAGAVRYIEANRASKPTPATSDLTKRAAVNTPDLIAGPAHPTTIPQVLTAAAEQFPAATDEVSFHCGAHIYGVILNTAAALLGVTPARAMPAARQADDAVEAHLRASRPKLHGHPSALDHWAHSASTEQIVELLNATALAHRRGVES